MTVEDYVEDQKLSLKTREEQLNRKQETLEAKENEIKATRDRLKRTNGIVFDRDADEQEQRWPSVLKNLQEQEEAIAETASKLTQIRPRA